MKTASISVTKHQLSALIEHVPRGGTILITDHGRPGSDEPVLLERKGIVRRRHGEGCRLAPLPVPAQHASAVQALLEERESVR